MFNIKTIIFAICLTSALAPGLSAQDGSNATRHKVTQVVSPDLPGHRITRPEDLKAVGKSEGQLPVLVWVSADGNETAASTLLTDIAAGGYMVIEASDDSASVNEVLQWVGTQSRSETGEYANLVNGFSLAAGGRPSGQVLSELLRNRGLRTLVLYDCAPQGKEGPVSAAIAGFRGSVLCLASDHGSRTGKAVRREYSSISNLPNTSALVTPDPKRKAGSSNAGTLVSDWLDWALKNASHGLDSFRNEGSADGLLVQTSKLPPLEFEYPGAHDPVAAFCNGRYYVFTTGMNVMSSSDLKHWRFEDNVLKTTPEWARKKGFRGMPWAPDIQHIDGKWYIYYSYSGFGKNKSAIGVAVNKTLDPESPDFGWEDKGMILESVPGRDEWNAIDANVILDEEGTGWLVFGSFWRGLKMCRLNEDYTRLAEPQEWYPVARRPEGTAPETVSTDTAVRPDPRGKDFDAGNGAIEAPFIIRHGGYYYLFASFDLCCRGEKSTYNVVVGRSESVTGPYYDKNGTDMMEGGGTPVVKGNERYPGAGHCAVVNFDGKDLMFLHGYDREESYDSKLLIQEISWSEDGWPTVELPGSSIPQPSGETLRRKVVDGGGSGPFKAEAREESSFPDAVVYRPVNLKEAASRSGLPVLVFANGGCNDTSLPHERLLTEVASRGYIVIALGSMQFSIDDRPLKKSPNSQMAEAMDWIIAQNADSRSEYHNCVATDRIAVGGQSCGGAQALANSMDPRVKTTIMMNSGMGDFEMSGADASMLDLLHAPILYLEGGPSDIAYANGVADYEKVNGVFAAFANHLTAGHVGDFGDEYGGSFARMLTAWLDWQLKDDPGQARIFTESALEDFPGWTTKAKNPVTGWKNEPFYRMEVHLENHRGNNLFGMLYVPDDNVAKKPLAILAHGYNSSYREVEAYAETLAQAGIASYIFDFAGGAVNSRSEGSSLDMSVFTEADDIAAIVEAAGSWSFIDPERISLLGCSQGGLVAAIASSLMPESFRSVVLVYPALSIAEHAVKLHPQEAITSETGVEVMGLPLSHNYYDRLIGYDVFKEMEKYDGDVMIVYGDKDPIAAGDYIQRAAEAYSSCEVNVVPGGTHGFPESGAHVLANGHILDFLVKTLLD